MANIWTQCNVLVFADSRQLAPRLSCHTVLRQRAMRSGKKMKLYLNTIEAYNETNMMLIMVK